MKYGKAADELFKALNGGVKARFDYRANGVWISLKVGGVTWGYSSIIGDERRRLILTLADDDHHILSCFVLYCVTKIEILGGNQSGTVYQITTESIDGTKSRQFKLSLDVPYKPRRRNREEALADAEIDSVNEEIEGEEAWV